MSSRNAENSQSCLEEQMRAAREIRATRTPIKTPNALHPGRGQPRDGVSRFCGTPRARQSIFRLEAPPFRPAAVPAGSDFFSTAPSSTRDVSRLVASPGNAGGGLVTSAWAANNLEPYSVTQKFHRSDEITKPQQEKEAVMGSEDLIDLDKPVYLMKQSTALSTQKSDPDCFSRENGTQTSLLDEEVPYLARPLLQPSRTRKQQTALQKMGGLRTSKWAK